MGNERGIEKGQPPSPLERIHTVVASVKLKEEMLEDERKFAANYIRNTLSELVDSLPESARGEVTNLTINQTNKKGHRVEELGIVYNPLAKELIFRSTIGRLITDDNIDHECGVWLRDGEEIAQELLSRAGNVVEVK